MQIVKNTTILYEPFFLYYSKSGAHCNSYMLQCAPLLLFVLFAFGRQFIAYEFVCKIIPPS